MLARLAGVVEPGLAFLGRELCFRALFLPSSARVCPVTIRAVDFLYALRERTFECLYRCFCCVVCYGFVVQARPVRFKQLRKLLPGQSKRNSTSRVNYGCVACLDLSCAYVIALYVVCH